MLCCICCVSQNVLLFRCIVLNCYRAWCIYNQWEKKIHFISFPFSYSLILEFNAALTSMFWINILLNIKLKMLREMFVFSWFLCWLVFQLVIIVSLFLFSFTRSCSKRIFFVELCARFLNLISECFCIRYSVMFLMLFHLESHFFCDCGSFV